jgi:hypothetical protein
MKKENGITAAFLLIGATAASAQNINLRSEMSWNNFSPFAQLVVILSVVTLVLWAIYVISIIWVKEDKEIVERRRRRSAPHYHAQDEYQAMTLANHLLAIRDRQQKEKLRRSPSSTARG